MKIGHGRHETRITIGPLQVVHRKDGHWINVAWNMRLLFLLLFLFWEKTFRFFDNEERDQENTTYIQIFRISDTTELEYDMWEV